MKKILGFTLTTFALAALSAPAFATRLGGSVRGDVGLLDSQLPYFGIDTIVDSTAYTSTVNTFYSDRKHWNWDFTGRLFSYLNVSPCDPCPIYLAASWQGSNHTVGSRLDPHLETALSRAIIPIRAHGEAGFLQPYATIGINTNSVLTLLPTVTLSPAVLTPTVVYDTVTPFINVRNEFSKAKLGIGFELIKTRGFGLTMEVGANYLKATLESEKQYNLVAADVATSSLFTLLSTVVPVLSNNVIVAPTFSDNLDIAPLANSPLSLTGLLPYDFVHVIHERDKTEGLGLYAMMKGEYKFSLGCFGNAFSVYGKAEVSDIIGRQTYDYEYTYVDHFASAPFADRLYAYREAPERQYNNIVEVDLEAALAYAPTFKCWDELEVCFALGVRTDSFVNLFSHVTYDNNQSIWNLSRSSLFFEVGIKG